MTFLHIMDQGLPKRALGERRTDFSTAASIDDALRARGRQAAAQALAYQDVDVTTALRVLAGPQRRTATALIDAADVPVRAGPFALAGTGNVIAAN